MTKLEDFLSLMECFPSAIAQPNNGFMPMDIVAMAAEIRKLANLPKPDMPGLPPTEWQYHGDCNGCGGPIFMRKD